MQTSVIYRLYAPDEFHRQYPMEALSRVGERVPLTQLTQLTQLIWAIQDPSSTVRQTALALVKQQAPDEAERAAHDATRILLGNASAPEDVVACGALWQVDIARSLLRIGLPTPEIVAKLASMIDWPHWRVKVAAIDALGEMKRHIPLETIERLKVLRYDLGEPYVVRDACDDSLAGILALDPMEDNL